MEANISKINEENGGVSMGTAAWITGLTLFVPAAPYAEFYVFNSLILYDDAAQTTINLLNHRTFFATGIFAAFFMFLLDVLLAWTNYIFLKPVSARLSLLAAWFRIVYTCLAMAALFNFIYAFRLVNNPGFQPVHHQDLVLNLVNARLYAMNLAYIVFGIYLILLGSLMCKSSYVPTALGVLLILAGVSWIAINLRPYFFHSYDVSWLMIFSAGELFYVLWLLIKGRKLKEADVSR